MTTQQGEDLDALLSTAMRARPDPAPLHNLAARAMANAAANDLRAAALMRLGAQMRWCSAAAGLLVAAVITVGICLYPATPSTTSAANSAAVLSSAATSSLRADAATLGIILFAAVLIGLTLKALLDAEPNRWRTLET
jgi:hypothetical protein